MSRVVLFGLVLMISLSQKAVSQEATPTNEQPKIGLVLSGGGAKGLAHIGVLKVIDSLGIKIDYIGGTSMGAMIGSLYASGYSGKELDSIFKTTDFDAVINDELPRNARTFYEKQDAERYAISLPFDGFKVSFPDAISRGQNVYNLMNDLLAHVRDENDFTKLSIPFFCIATNIETGEEKIFDSGFLPEVVSASGALPSLFSPVQINGNIYIDGGVVNNYPVEELRARGMDFIIGVDVQDNLASREDIGSALDVLLQINNFKSTEQMEEKRKLTDIYIKPNIQEFTVVDFNLGAQIIETGMIETLRYILPLKEISSNYVRDYQRFSINATDLVQIDHVTLKGNKNYSRSYILGKLGLRPPEIITYEELSQKLANLQSTDNFKRIDYRIEKQNERSILIIDLDENDENTLLRLGLHYDSLFGTSGLVNITRKRVLFGNDVASLDFIIGDNIRYNFEYYLDKGYYWSVGFNARFDEFDTNVSTNLATQLSDVPLGMINRLGIKYRDWTNTIYVETVVSQILNLRLGAEHKKLKIFSETIGSDMDDSRRTFEDSDFLSAYGTLTYDTLDNKYYPSSGFYFNGDFHWYVYSSDFNDNFVPFSIAQASFGYAYPFTDWLSGYAQFDGGFQLGNNSNSSFDFLLGGYGSKSLNNFKPFYGYDFISIAGDSYVKTLLELDFNPWGNHHLVLSYNIANIEDDLFEGAEYFEKADYNGIAIGYGLETFIGPIEFKYSYTPDLRQSEFYFNLGFWF